MFRFTSRHSKDLAFVKLVFFSCGVFHFQVFRYRIPLLAVSNGWSVCLYEIKLNEIKNPQKTVLGFSAHQLSEVISQTKTNLGRMGTKIMLKIKRYLFFVNTFPFHVKCIIYPFSICKKATYIYFPKKE